MKKNNDWFQDKLIKSKRNNFLTKLFHFLVSIPLKIAVSPKWWREHKANAKDLVERSAKTIASKEFAFIPAGFALYLFISFVPIIVFTLSILTSIDFYILDFKYSFKEFILSDILNRYIPGLGQTLPKTFGFFSGSTWANTAFVFLIISSIWISSSGYSKFISSQSIIYNHKNLGNPIWNRVKGIIIVICISLLLCLIFLIVGPLFMVIKRDVTNSIAYDFIFYFLSTIFLFAFTYLGFLFLFKFSPNFRISFKQSHPGALITSIPSALFTIIFGFLASSNLINYNKFGTLATFMFLSTFMFFMSYFIYFGLITNESFYKSFFSQTTKDKSLFNKNIIKY